MHCHTLFFGSRGIWSGAPCASIGGPLDWIRLCSLPDHAYDFAFSKKTIRCPIRQTFGLKALRQEIQELPSSPLMIAGEEVSVGNSHNENVHMLCLSPRVYLEGKGDCGRYGLNNKPTWGISKTISIANAPCFAAHPKVPMSKLERFVFRRGDWHDEDLQLESETPIRGIQFWNGSRDRGFELGRLWWISLLEKGHEILPLRKRHHGDLNVSSITIPLISRHNRNHVLGK